MADAAAGHLRPPRELRGRESYPTGIETVTKLPNLTQGLIDGGYDRDQVRAIMGGNWLDAFRRFCG